jgi:hypothetical protein
MSFLEINHAYYNLYGKGVGAETEAVCQLQALPHMAHLVRHLPLDRPVDREVPEFGFRHEIE